MNKKVSTILTCGLMLGSSLLAGTAFAAPGDIIPISEAKTDGTTYALVSTAWYENGWKDRTQQGSVDEYVTYKDGKFQLTQDPDEKIVFTVSKSGNIAANALYTFNSKDGGNLTVKNGDVSGSGFYLGNSYSGGDKATDAYARALQFGATDKDGNEIIYEVADNGADRTLYGHQKTGGTDTYSPQAFVLEEVAAGDVSDSQLNEFFNTKGFNLDVKKDNADVDLAENLFGGESRIWAFQIRYVAGATSGNTIENAANVAWENETTKTGFIGYKVSEDGANGEDLIIPEGIYFFTDRVLKDGAKPEALTAEDIDWTASTFIVVSPRETVETTVDNRSAGQGFKLVTAKGEEFIYEKNTSEFAVGDLPIYNACFNVKDNHAANDNYPYSIALKHFYYQKKAGDDMTVKADLAENMNLGVLEFDATEIQYLTTVPGSSREYIFKLSDSAAVDGIDLLNTDKTPAVYTIRFVAGNEEDEELVGKYLTVGVDTNDEEVATGSDFHWVAKGSMISNPTYPSFQYTITAVDKETGKLVTFTNRETNKSFTAQLFPEEGTNRYSIACVTSEGEPMDLDVMPLDVNTTLYTVEKAENADVTIDEDVIIELTPVTPDEYAGFYNVDSESVRTIRFARDKNDTSYKWYAGVAVNANGNVLTNLKEGKGNDYFVEDVYEAAQWQLIKAGKPNTIARTFVYNNTTTESVDNVVNGDKVSAYQYVLRYVQDGTPSKYYLTDGGDIALVDAEAAFKAYDKKKDFDELTSAQKFYIKENADGSVSLFGPKYSFGADNTDQKIVTKATKNVSIDAEVNQTNGTISYVNKVNNREYRSAVYAYTSSADNLKVYLDGEAPNFSWTEEGHVTMQNGTSSVAGNYVSMNAANEGVLLNSEEGDVFYLHMTDNKSVVPSFYISLGQGEGSDALSERLFLYNPVDSVSYPVDRPYDANYQLSKNDTKAIFKAGSLDASRDTMTTSIKGEEREIAVYADNESTWGGLNRFKFQIIESANEDGLYNIRQIAGGIENGQPTSKTVYLASSGEKLYFTTEKDYALALGIKGVEAPTANEAISATDVKVVAYDGAINIKNAAGKNVVVSTILGQIVANEVLTSDNATISVPAGIAIVSVDGEEAVKVSVR